MLIHTFFLIFFFFYYLIKIYLQSVIENNNWGIYIHLYIFKTQFVKENLTINTFEYTK
jgi:hypothetical protein